MHRFNFKRATQGWGVTLASEILGEVLTPQEKLGWIMSEAALFGGTPQLRRLMQDIPVRIPRTHFARAHLLKTLSALLLGYVARAPAAGKTPAGAGTFEIIGKFEALLDAHFVEHWPVARYSATIKITPTRLSRPTREAFGGDASHMICDHIVRETKRNPVYTDLPVCMIPPISAASSRTPPGCRRANSASGSIRPRKRATC